MAELFNEYVGYGVIGFGERGKGKGERGKGKGKREREKGKEKTFTLYPVGELVEPLTFSQNQIPS
ncbi:hypothetical protein VF14_33445 [Nostoc linckia z18]|jgi:hypothetical protein|uniref:Uncharacterized protein n=2 Tax=Nostoc linckia TaxID=92942 RepID=A0A9Q5Z7P2_NOSLI|nr:hypothetical protein VF02_36170 [Nostoc linckia z1]PHJ56615.1 hypothetical protein VF05_36990 [Nostoc linckia z3]PHJ57662.1 hypothetical protein VF03_36285 [Nostoc linckia z2]PHJ78123.1 hypothetical protein VF07_35450 [Nostoc linckia z6]PHJ78807.1 hypothetical protein VF06_27980 [Nostoc linckia z4]PHJ94348.1 hypothetical protein VF04_22825 [Nostoc linckia z7]PHJ98035.1 hypothetical protein VF08_27565 [Nostoc linckia z8]PHK01686.1 hypothetical protein VF09_32760 [Nostoc linckia z9]PHK1492